VLVIEIEEDQHGPMSVIRIQVQNRTCRWWRAYRAIGIASSGRAMRRPGSRRARQRSTLTSGDRRWSGAAQVPAISAVLVNHAVAGRRPDGVGPARPRSRREGRSAPSRRAGPAWSGAAVAPEARSANGAIQKRPS
jgi:hypothetical protein